MIMNVQISSMYYFIIDYLIEMIIRTSFSLRSNTYKIQDLYTVQNKISQICVTPSHMRLFCICLLNTHGSY